MPKRAKKSRNGNFKKNSEIGVLHGVPKRIKKAETATLKKFRDRSFTWGAETGKMAFCVFLCRNGVIPVDSLTNDNLNDI